MSSLVSIPPLKKNLLTWWQLGILAPMIFLPLCIAGPEIWPDTEGYLHFALYRPPVYPIFLWLFHGFGKQQLVIAMWVQATLFFLTIVYVSGWLRDRLEMPKILIFLLLFSMIALLDRFLVFNNILSDLISFSLFLLTLTFLVDCFEIINVRKIIWLSIVSSLLILTREQFYYLYPLLFALIFWYIWKKELARKIILSSTIIVLSIVMTFCANRGYHYLVNQGASPVVPGVAVLEQALYLSDYTDHTDFSDATQKNYFIKTIRLLEKRRLTKKTMDVPGIKPFQPMTLDVANQMYNLAYLAITHAAKSNFPLPDFYSYNSAVFIEKLVWKLYTHNLKENILFSTWRIISLMGGIWFFVGFMIAMLCMLLRVILDRAWRPSAKQFFVMISFYLMFSNAVIVGLFSDNESRYFYYTYFLYFCLFGLLASELFIKWSNTQCQRL